MAVLADVVFDCARPASLARFWAAALDRYEVDRLVGLGAPALDDQPNDGLVVLHDPEGNEFCLLRR